ncbi:MAG TPA: HEAT repeat domain-containing protein [Candidatus Mcinerneyibacteriales bacterium]|nr:HEAT repeat domain-containing protein [Candidatus Mcinerneyibacteriales bacterium]
MAYRSISILFIALLLLSAYAPPETPLASLPAGTPAGVKTAVTNLFSQDPDILAEALITLQEAGPKALNAVPYLADILDDTTTLTVQGLQSVSQEAAAAIAAVGPAAEKSIIALLSSPKPLVRGQAASILGRWRSATAIDRLNSMATTESNTEARVKVISALGEIKNRSSIIPLLSLLAAENESVERAVVQALASIGYPAIKPLSYNLASPEPLKRANAARALGLIGDTLCLNDLKSLVSDQDTRVRVAVAEALGSINLNDAIDILIGLLNDPEAQVSRQAVLSLGKYPDNRIINSLVEGLAAFDDATAAEAGTLIKKMDLSVSRPVILRGLSSQNPRLIGHLLDYIEEKKWEGFSQAIIPIISSGLPTEIKLKAMETLIALKAKEALAVMETTVTSSDKRLSTRALSALLNYNEVSRDTADLVAARLGDPDKEIRLMVAEALPATDSYRLTPVITDALIQNPYSEVKVYCLKALGKLKYNKALPQITPLINDPNESVRTAAAEALVNIGDSSTADLFRTYITDENPEIRGLCARGLAVINDSSSSAPLINALSDKAASVRTQAISALGRLKIKEALNPIIQIFYDDPDLEPRVAAVEAISLIDTTFTSTFILDGMKSKNIVLKKAALTAAARYSKNKDVMTALVSLLDDKDPGIRTLALESLQNASGKKYKTLEDWSKWASSL